MSRIHVLIVDDSAVVRQVLQEVLGSDPQIDVVGTAADPLFAASRMQNQWPDVIVLDVEMPRMDGISFLRKIMQERPTPVIICSTLTEKGAQTTMQAMEAGAFCIMTKPKLGLKSFLEGTGAEMIKAVKAAARANVSNLRPVAVRKLVTETSSKASSMVLTTDQLVAIGTSTGGTQALERLLSALPQDAPGLVIVQHMPEKFTAMFAQRLNQLCRIEVREARDGDRVLKGQALIAPGGRHMHVRRSGATYQVEIRDGPLVNRHKPSVDVLFRSVAQYAGGNAMGIIMTGMGDDGARGLLQMRDQGAVTLAQDEASCVVFGMPKEAIALGAVDKVMPLQQLPSEIMRHVRARTV